MWTIDITSPLTAVYGHCESWRQTRWWFCRGNGQQVCSSIARVAMAHKKKDIAVECRSVLGDNEGEVKF